MNAYWLTLFFSHYSIDRVKETQKLKSYRSAFHQFISQIK